MQHPRLEQHAPPGPGQPKGGGRRCERGATEGKKERRREGEKETDNFLHMANRRVRSRMFQVHRLNRLGNIGHGPGKLRSQNRGIAAF